MPGTAKTTTNHSVIRKWAETRGGKPSSVKSTTGKNDPGLLRIDFPGYKGKRSLEHISWNEFFRKFDQKHLVFLYQDRTSRGGESRFFKFVSPETEKKRKSARSGRRSRRS